MLPVLGVRRMRDLRIRDPLTSTNTRDSRRLDTRELAVTARHWWSEGLGLSGSDGRACRRTRSGGRPFVGQ